MAGNNKISSQTSLYQRKNPFKRYYLLIVIVVAIMARIIYLVADIYSPLFLYPIIDENEFLNNALQMARNNFSYPWHYWHPPGYSYFLAVLFSIGFSNFSVIIIQFFAGVCGTVLLYLGLNKFNAKAAFIVAIIWAIYPLEIFTETKFLSENLFTFLVLVLFWWMVSNKQNQWWYIISGLLTSLLIVTKTQFVLFLVLFIPVLIVYYKPKFANILIYIGISLALPFMASIQNVKATHGRFVFVSTNGPVNLYIGNAENIEKTLNIRPYEWKEKFFPELYEEKGIKISKSLSDSGETLPYKLSSLFSKKTMNANSNLAVLFKNLGYKMFILLNAHETPRNYDIYEYRKLNPYLKLTLFLKPICFPLALFYYAAILFLIMNVRRIFRDKKLLIMFLLIFVTLVPSVLFFNAFRYRLTAIPFLLFFAVLFYSENFKNIKIQLINLLLILVFGTLIFQQLLIQKIPLFETYDFYGDGFLEKKHQAKALYWYQKSIDNAENTDEYRRNSLQIMLNLGNLKQKEGNPVEAINYYSRGIQFKKDDYRPYLYLAPLRYQVMDFSGAIKDYDQLISNILLPSDELKNAYHGRGLCRGRLNDLKGALDDFNHTLALDSLFSKAFSDRGVIKARMNDISGALADFNTAIRLSPADYNSYHNRAGIWAGQGKLKEALADLDKTIELNPGYGDAYLMRAMLKVELGRNTEVCDDLKLAVKAGNKRAVEMIPVYCK